MGDLGLTLHLLGVAGWVGGAIYERLFIFGVIKKRPESPLALTMTNMMLRTAPFFVISALLLLLGGVTMTLHYNLGWFRLNWVGLKQGVMVLILLQFLLLVAPSMKRLERDLAGLADRTALLPAPQREQIYRIQTILDIGHIGVLANVILGIWKPL